MCWEQELMDRYEDENYDNSDPNYVHVDEIPRYDNAKDFLLVLINAIFETGDKSVILDCLEEITHDFGIKLPSKEMKI